MTLSPNTQITQENAPEAPWPVGRDNAKREAWKLYFSGRAREDCPFPPARSDLQRDWRTGWDAAAAFRPALSPPAEGEIETFVGILAHANPRTPTPAPVDWNVVGPKLVEAITEALCLYQTTHIHTCLRAALAAAQPEGRT